MWLAYVLMPGSAFRPLESQRRLSRRGELLRRTGSPCGWLSGLLSGAAVAWGLSASAPCFAAEPAFVVSSVEGAPAILRAAREAAVGVVATQGAPSTQALQDPLREGVLPPRAAYVGWGIGALGLAFGVGLRLEELRLNHAFDGLCNRGACRPDDDARARRLVSGLKRLRHYRRLSFGTATLGAGAGGLLFFLGSSSRRIGSVRCRAWVGFGSGGVAGDF